MVALDYQVGLKSLRSQSVTNGHRSETQELSVKSVFATIPSQAEVSLQEYIKQLLTMK